MMERHRNRAYRSAVTVAILTSLLTMWTTVVRDDSTGAAYFMLIMAVVVGWFSAGFEPIGMARTMVGIAIMQLANGVLVATAPMTANLLDGPLKALLFNGFFAALWLISAALFWRCSKGDQKAKAR